MRAARHLTYLLILAAMLVAILCWLNSRQAGTGSGAGAAAPDVPAAMLRLGHFPNVTHAQALLARATGAYDKALGVPVKWQVFSAGPSAVEAMFAGEIDATYVGPNPAINGFIKSRGECFVIVAGSASGGAALVVRPGSGIETDRDFNDKIVATPQLGNTQDVAARHWFASKGYQAADKGGRLTILPMANADQLLMFQKKEIHAAWTIEPWVSRLVQEGGGKVFMEEGSLWPGGRYVTTQLIVRRDFLKRNPDVVRKLLAAHVEMTQQLNADKTSAAELLSAEIGRETGKPMPPAILRSAMTRVEFTWDPIASSLAKSAADAAELKFLPEKPDLAGIYELGLLNDVLSHKALPQVRGLSPVPASQGGKP